MIYGGLVSITFRKLSPEEIVALVAEAGLTGIEWGGDVHVPHGNLEQAENVRKITEDAGLKVAAYGSYYRAGVSEDDGLSFDAVLATAEKLGAPVIRVWAGNRGSDKISAADRMKVVADINRVSDLAAAKGIRVDLEYHVNTLTDTPSSVEQLIAELGETKAGFYWQPPAGMSPKDCLASFKAIESRVGNLHVFQWIAWEDGVDRRALSEGAGVWEKYLSAAPQGQDRYALIEFVRDEKPEQFLEDAAALKIWLEKINGSEK